MKKFLIVGACLAFALLLSLGLVAACVVRAGQHLSFAFSQDDKASRQETHTLELEPGRLLGVELPAGTIRVTATADQAPSVSATITAYASTQEKADAALAETKLDLEPSTDGVRICLRSASGRDPIRHSASADLEIRVPAGVRLDLHSGSGDVEGDGPFATAKVHSSYGSVRIGGVEGDVEATSSSGGVSVASARGKKLVARSDYGNVHVSDSESTTVEARSSSGDVKLEKVRSERCKVGSSYGDVELLDVDGEIEAKLSSGTVRLAHWAGDRASLSTDYGNVRVEGASGSVEAKSSSGEVRVSELEGSLVAHSSYGAVHVEGRLSGLRADTSSGSVFARALPGSRAEGTWKLSSSYGNVKLVLPESFACRLDAKTDYGDVDVGFPVEIQPGRHKKGVLQGDVNGGGSSVELRCTSGDVRVEKDGR